MAEVSVSISDVSINIENEKKIWNNFLSQKSNNLFIILKDLNPFPLKLLKKNFLKLI